MSDELNPVAWMWQESWPCTAGGKNTVFIKLAVERPNPAMLYVLPDTIQPLYTRTDVGFNAGIEAAAKVAEERYDKTDWQDPGHRIAAAIRNLKGQNND